MSQDYDEFDFDYTKDPVIRMEPKPKMRPLRVRMLDGTVKTVLVDETQPVANLMVVICTKIGITNHDEFSLVRESDQEAANSGIWNSGTMSIRRTRDRDRTLDYKMEQLKKKLKTDDDLDWVDHGKTLPEQGIMAEETLLLRRKFFFSDHNVDSRDPVQLNLLYVQARDAIIGGSHPVTMEEACRFAGIQCQVQLGDHVDTKHKAGFLDLKDVLPKDFAKVKGVEKRVFAEHRKQQGLSDLVAKTKYFTHARTLKTYGVTFFLVKEKMKGKNKLVPRLLGVTKDSVLRLDERTKEIVKTWPLTTVKRWAASPNSFTLDFGDYSDSYYSVQTTEGEQISQLIAGYIDIILKRKKAKDHFGIEGDEGSTMVEDSVAPYKATILQHQTAPKPAQPLTATVALPTLVPTPTSQSFDHGHHVPQSPMMQRVMHPAHVGQTPKVPPQVPMISTSLGEPQRALVSNIGRGREAIRHAESELQDPTLPSVDLSAAKKQVTFDLKKEALNAQLSATSAATAQLITLTSVQEADLDYPAIGHAVQTVAANLPEIAKDVKVVAHLMQHPGQGKDLIAAAKTLCAAFRDLLSAAEPSPHASHTRQDLLHAAARVGDATQTLLSQLDLNREPNDRLLSLAKGVATAASNLVLKAKDVSATCSNAQDENRVIAAASQCALATSQLVTCAKVVSGTIEHPMCQRQVTQSCRHVATSVETIVQVGQECAPHQDRLLGDLKSAAAAVAHALNDLLNHVKDVEPPPLPPAPQPEPDAVGAIYTATDRIFGSEGDPNEMIRQAKILAKATVQLINNLKGQAQSVPDSDTQKRLIVAARLLADATARLVDAAKGCKVHPLEPSYHQAIKQAAQDLRVATDTASHSEVHHMSSSSYMSSSSHHHAHYGRESPCPPLPPPPPANYVLPTQSPTPTVRTEPTYEEIREGAPSPATYSAKVTRLEQTTNYSEIRESRSSERTLTGALGNGSSGVRQLTDREIFLGESMVPPAPPVRGSISPVDLNQSDGVMLRNIHSSQDHHHHMTSSTMTTNGMSQQEALVLSELQNRAKGTQACTCAASTVSGIIGDLETTMMFATAGTLNPDEEGDAFSLHKENIFKKAKCLVEDTKTLVAGAASSQEQLAVAAQSAVVTMVTLADVVKLGAASLGSNNAEAQVMLINAVKDVATALGELIQATKNAAGKSVNDPTMNYLREAAKVMIVNATSLLKTVRTVEDEHERGTSALESTIEAIGQELRAFESQEPPLKQSSPDDLVRVTKPVTHATAKAVAAGTSHKQEDIIVAANMGRKCIFDVLVTVRQAAYACDSYELRTYLLEAGKKCALHYRQLLQMVLSLVQRSSSSTSSAHEKQLMVDISRRIAQSVTDIVTGAERIKGSMDDQAHQWIHPEDPTAIAETELLGSASSIDAAAKKLASLRPRQTSVKVPDEDMNFDELILEAARCIATATAALVRAASGAQRELIATGRAATRSPFSTDDGQWSEGLISGARHVAAATHSLVEAANALVQGQASEERLISAAQQVASSTAQLLVACKVKADSTSVGMKRLQAAGHAVKKATENLVKAAQQAIEHDEEQSIVLSRRRVSGIAQEISFREAILKKERELEEAREKLAAVRRAKYSKANGPPGSQYDASPYPTGLSHSSS